MMKKAFIASSSSALAPALFLLGLNPTTNNKHETRNKQQTILKQEQQCPHVILATSVKPLRHLLTFVPFLRTGFSKRKNTKR